MRIKIGPSYVLPYFRGELPPPVLHDEELESSVDLDIDPVKPHNMASGEQQLLTRIRKLVRSKTQSDKLSRDHINN